ncbi:MAG: hypothetical protein ACXW4H_01245 [Candidatus Limnocylindrales bacterium]
MATTARPASGLDVALRLASSDDVVVAYQACVRALGVPETEPSVSLVTVAAPGVLRDVARSQREVD